MLIASLCIYGKNKGADWIKKLLTETASKIVDTRNRKSAFLNDEIIPHSVIQQYQTIFAKIRQNLIIALTTTLKITILRRVYYF
jgi:hypothetical protein